MKQRPRIALVCLITAALLAAAAWAGAGGLLLSADRVYAIPVIGALVLLGVAYGWAGNWDAMEWISENLPKAGLIFTVLGVLLAIRNVTAIDEGAGLRIFTEVGESLVANLVAMAGNWWLSTLRRVCEPKERTYKLAGDPWSAP